MKLELLNVSTKEQVACVQGHLSLPHSRGRHDYITMKTSSRDTNWLLLVIASGMAEASCLGCEHY